MLHWSRVDTISVQAPAWHPYFFCFVMDMRARPVLHVNRLYTGEASSLQCGGGGDGGSGFSSGRGAWCRASKHRARRHERRVQAWSAAT